MAVCGAAAIYLAILPGQELGRSVLIAVCAGFFFDAFFWLNGDFFVTYFGEEYNGLSTIRKWWEDGDQEVQHSPEVVEGPFRESLPHGDGITGDE